MQQRIFLSCVLLFFFSLLQFNSFGQYSASPSNTSSGNSTWGASVTNLAVGINGNNATFNVTKVDGGTFSSSGDMYLDVYSGGSLLDYYGPNPVIANSTSNSLFSNINLANFNSSDFPLTFYSFYEGADGFSETGPITIYKANTVPSSPSISAPSTATVGQNVTVSLTTGIDADGDNVKVHATSTGSNYPGGSSTYISSWYSSSGGSPNATFNWSSAGTYTIYATTFDANGAASSTTSRSITINANNTAPSSPSISAPSTATVGQNVTVSLTTGIDADGDNVKVHATSTGSNYPGGSSTYISSWYSSSGGSPNATFNWSSAGTYTIYATTFDANGAASSTTSRSITINANNTAPSSPSISAPSTATVGQNVTVSLTTGIDADGDNVKVHATSTGSNYPGGSSTYISSWYSSSGGSPNATFNWSSAGTYTIYATTFDANGAASSTTSKSITINANSESDDLPNGANTLILNSFANDIILDDTDQDWFKVTVPEEGALTISIDVFNDFNVQFRLFDNSILSLSNPNSSTNSIVPTRYTNPDGNPGNDNGLGVNEFYENLDVEPGEYYIKVAIQDNSATNKPYRIYADFLPTPTLTSPINGVTNVSITPSFSWTSSTADEYHLQINDVNTWSAGFEFDQNIGNTTNYNLTTANQLNNNTTYFWRVRSAKTLAIDNGRTIQSLYSNESYFGNTTDNRSFTTLNNTGGSCTYSDVDTQTPWASTAATELCNQGIIDDDGIAEPTNPLNRAELAKMLYFAIDLELNGYVQGTIHNYPSPFNDLQNTALWDYYYAKTLSYLEFNGDCITPFDRNAFNFYRGNGIARKYLVKAILETFDVDMDAPLGAEPFSDVDSSTDDYEYIVRAYNDGIISGDGNNGVTFRPDDLALRAEAFVMLYNALQIYGVPAVSINDFYEPGNYTPNNFAQASGSHSGNFNFYTKTSFAINSIGLPLNFGHTYNSYLGDLPKEFFRMQPLGAGWSHTYNSYIMEISGSQTADDRVVQMLPNGTIHVFEKEGNSYSPETAGVYSDLEKITGTIFTLTTKSQVKFTYEKVNHTNTFGSQLYKLVRIQDRNNNTVTLSYENASQTNMQRLKSVTGTAGRKLFFYYHSNSDRIQRISDPINRSIYYNYSTGADGETYMTSFTNAKGDNTIYGYPNDDCDAHLMNQITLPKGNVITNDYQKRKLASTQTNGGNLTTFSRTFSHGSSGSSVVATSNTNGYGTVTTNYNSNAVPTSITTPSSSTTVAYGISDQPTKPTSMNPSSISGSLSYSYDGKGNLLQMNLPYSISHSYTYNGTNDMVSYTNPEGKQWTNSYDGNGNLNGVTSWRGTTSYSRQSNGLVTQVTNPENLVTTFGYDNYGNVTTTAIPAEGISTSANYDLASRVVQTMNPNGQATTYTFDANDNLLSTNFAGAYTNAYQYDDNDNLTQITNAKGFSTNMTYDPNNDFHMGTSFEGHDDEYTYYDDGRLESHTDPKGATFTNNYDTQKRLSSISSPNDNIVYTYDARDNVKTIQNSNGTIEFYYDNINRITQTKDIYNNIVGYTYFKDGNIKTIVYPGNKVVSYTYYNDNLLHTVSDWNNNTTSYTYRDDGLLAQVSYPNGTYCSYTYDGAARNTSQIWRKANSDIIASYNRTFDPFGNITQESAVEPMTMAPLATASTAYSYSSDNRIQTAGTTNFSFKADGTAQTKGNTYTYTFDDYERLTSVSGDLTASYTYDALGHRRAKTVNGTSTRFVLDILGMSKVLMEQSSNGSPQHYYVYGLSLISRIGADATTTHYYHGDYRGSTVAMTNASAAITHQYAYGAYGENAGVQEPSGDSNLFRYVGMHGVQCETDDIYFMRARYYDSYIGRFLSEDPIWHTNLYNYANGNPITGIDPNGLDRIGAWSTDFQGEIQGGFATASTGGSYVVDQYGNQAWICNFTGGGTNSIDMCAGGSIGGTTYFVNNICEIPGLTTNVSAEYSFATVKFGLTDQINPETRQLVAQTAYAGADMCLVNNIAGAGMSLEVSTMDFCGEIPKACIQSDNSSNGYEYDHKYSPAYRKTLDRDNMCPFFKPE